MQTGQFNSAPDAVRLILKKEGYKGLFAVLLFSFYEGQASVMITLNNTRFWHLKLFVLQFTLMEHLLTLYCAINFQSN